MNNLTEDENKRCATGNGKGYKLSGKVLPLVAYRSPAESLFKTSEGVSLRCKTIAVWRGNRKRRDRVSVGQSVLNKKEKDFGGGNREIW